MKPVVGRLPHQRFDLRRVLLQALQASHLRSSGALQQLGCAVAVPLPEVLDAVERIPSARLAQPPEHVAVEARSGEARSFAAAAAALDREL